MFISLSLPISLSPHLSLSSSRFSQRRRHDPTTIQLRTTIDSRFDTSFLFISSSSLSIPLQFKTLISPNSTPPHLLSRFHDLGLDPNQSNLRSPQNFSTKSPPFNPFSVLNGLNHGVNLPHGNPQRHPRVQDQRLLSNQRHGGRQIRRLRDLHPRRILLGHLLLPGW